MSYRIRQGLSYCLCEDRPIFLDVELGRYSTLPTELCGPFAALMSNEGGVAPRDIERLLALPVIESGIHTRSEEHTSELQSLMRISYAVFCLQKHSNRSHSPSTPPSTQ